jgi:transcriptional regulator with XRE-family HTH domain
MNSYEYIAEVKRSNGLDTDYKVAKMLGCGQNKITQYKNGQSMDNETARQIAEILGIPVWQVIADMEVMRAKTEPTKKAWKMLAKMSKEAGYTLPSLLILNSIIFYEVQYCILCKIANVAKRLPNGVSPNYSLLA